MVQRLCDADANVNFQQDDTTHHLTALHSTAVSKNLEIVEYLLQHKATINVSNETDGSQLFIAASSETLGVGVTKRF